MRFGEDRIGDQGHAVGDGELLEEPQQHELEAEVQPQPVPAFRPARLWQEVAGLHDRTGDQVREEQDEQEEVRRIALRRQSAAVDVHQVVDRLKGVERQTDRHQQTQQRQLCRGPGGVQCLLQRLQKEVRIFEIAEQSDVARQAEKQQAAAPRGLAASAMARPSR